MTEETKLLTCPYCGSAARIQEYEVDYAPSGVFEYAVGCTTNSCIYWGNVTPWVTEKEVAIEKWNYRASPKFAAPQPLAVVVPAIQWGEWRFLNGWTVKDSTCGKYRIVRDGQRFRLASAGIYYDTEEAAIAACQAHKEAQITKALEGCSVVIARDVGVLVEQIKTEITNLDAECKENTAAQNNHIAAMFTYAAFCGRIKGIIKAWEAGK